MNPKINLKYYRELKNISQRQLAKKMKISQGYISSVEKGIKSPTLRMIYNISIALDVCPRMMLGCTIDCSNCNKETKCKCKCSI